VFPHYPFGERKHHAFQREKIDDGIVVLEPVHAPNRSVGEALLFVGESVAQYFEVLQQLCPFAGFELRFLFRRHFLEVDHVNELGQQFWILTQGPEVLDFEQVDFALNLSVLAVTFNAMILKDRQNGASLFGAKRKSHGKKQTDDGRQSKHFRAD
jgi:hypothetical protein